MAARVICRCLQLGPAGELGRMILPCVQQCKGVRNGPCLANDFVIIGRRSKLRPADRYDPEAKGRFC
jgi:hypothetical protein